MGEYMGSADLPVLGQLPARKQETYRLLYLLVAFFGE